MNRVFQIALLLGLALGLKGATVYVDRTFTGPVELGTPAAPFKKINPAEAAAAPGDNRIITAGDYHESVRFLKPGSVLASGGPVTIGVHAWGQLANPGFVGQPIKTTLFFAGRPIDGTGTTNENGCGPVPNTTNIYSVYPENPAHLNWVDSANPASSANREFALQSIAAAGLNVVSMSSWGESWLPCSTPCPQVADSDCPCVRYTCVSREARCFRDPVTNEKRCLIGWYGSANMQVSPQAKDQLFDATIGKPLLIIPFIESRFGFDWDFHDEFPYDSTNGLAPGLISQVEDLVNSYLLHPRNPQWAQKWARVFDQDGQERYAVSIVQVATDRLVQTDPNSHKNFAADFDAVAQRVLADTGVKVGFFIDPIAPNPTRTFGCNIDLSLTVSTYGANFKPDPEQTGPYLRQQKSILGIQCFSPEGWIDGINGDSAVDACYKREWKKDFSRRWFNTGIPFLQDVTPGYDATILFANRPGGLKKWGYDDAWRSDLTQLVQDYGQAGMVYNAWNGYPEGLAGMEVRTNGVSLPPACTIDWLKSLTALYR